MVQYEVARHEIDPASPRHQHRWVTITPRPIGLTRATALADAEDTHATVQVWRSSEKVYDNGKLPRTAQPVRPIAASAGAAGTPRAGSPRPTLPRIVRHLGVVESDVCPHCGASGRYVHRFQLEDGSVAGAMSGCVKLFPISPVAAEEMRLSKKARTHGGRRATSWDAQSLDAIEAYHAGRIDEAQAIRAIASSKRAAADWYRRRGR